MRKRPLRPDVTMREARSTGASAFWRATGLAYSDFDKPIVAARGSFVDLVPGHVHPLDVGPVVAAAIPGAGALPMETDTIAVDDGIAMRHAGVLYSLPFRKLIADPVEYMANARQVDAMGCLSNCDKIPPGGMR